MGNQIDSSDVLEQLSSGQMEFDDVLNTANKFLAENEIEKAYPFACFIADSESSRAANAVTAGIIALTLERKKEAAGYFKLAMTKEPDNFDASYNLALLNIEKNNFTTAYELLEILSEKNPALCDLKSDLAVVSIKLNKIDQAISLWDESLKLNPNFSTARNNAMEFFIEQGMAAKAISLLDANDSYVGINESAKAEINRWREIITDKIENSFTDLDKETIES